MSTDLAIIAYIDAISIFHRGHSFFTHLKQIWGRGQRQLNLGTRFTKSFFQWQMTQISDKPTDNQSEARISVAYNKNCHLPLMKSFVKRPPDVTCTKHVIPKREASSGRGRKYFRNKSGRLIGCRVWGLDINIVTCQSKREYIFHHTPKFKHYITQWHNDALVFYLPCVMGLGLNCNFLFMLLWLLSWQKTRHIELFKCLIKYHTYAIFTLT